MSLVAEETGEVEVAGEPVCEAGTAGEAAGEAGGVPSWTDAEGGEEPSCIAGPGYACMAGGGLAVMLGWRVGKPGGGPPADRRDVVGMSCMATDRFACNVVEVLVGGCCEAARLSKKIKLGNGVSGTFFGGGKRKNCFVEYDMTRDNDTTSGEIKAAIAFVVARVAKEDTSN